MKKILFTCVGAMILSLSNVSAQAVEEGNVIIDAYYGFPNLYTAVFKTAYANTGSEVNLKVGGIGPIGLRAEYMVADKIGVGLDIGFNNSFVRYSEESTVYNSTTGAYDAVDYDYDFSTKKLGFMATFNYHFIKSSDVLDAYFVVGAGYGSRSFAFESTNPDYVEGSVSSLIPVAGRIGVGMRYFFTDNIGANLALGFGQGGILNAGLSVKL
jgi:outer membrane protein W